ncbi:NUDIX domain-containing protein [Sphingomonas quercus]|uniref:NUDIX domain-containing protein n=1 Tax=Sphingomonas quercus TaxID=2842451 RepID=A0ABS6BD98_9SPHN|nr:NUDIX domain-containing protein [Sphingomonas quercus]MBU3076291.1 NUDIX domain-containing protein [Sphingomonas quercus]
MPDEIAPIPAASLIVMRERVGGPPELLMLERSPAMRFAAGALVFPGGRVEPADGPRDSDAAARVAAIRETIEEARLAIAVTPEPGPPQLARLAEGLRGGGAFASLLAAEGLSADPAALVPFARWRPNFHETRAFDARFYLAVTTTSALPEPDGTECVAAFWASAAEILTSGRPMLFPTRRNLERLAQFASFAEAVADAGRHPPRLITPRVERRPDGDWLTIPDDLGYPVTAEPLARARRS